MTRYGQQQQQQQQAPIAIAERPLPPQRTSAALSNPNGGAINPRQTTNPNGITILRPNVTTVSASEPRKLSSTPAPSITNTVTFVRTLFTYTERQFFPSFLLIVYYFCYYPSITHPPISFQKSPVPSW
ncbi:unnamed protein product [Echinostoma caproni]|uniref:Uncharacterized protein n=1 Tax=Echinostoma caproni TaxID=27848 RepID=A0A183BBP7_9TREM|nr:unnamed protein product [Echinostoma caproni]